MAYGLLSGHRCAVAFAALGGLHLALASFPVAAAGPVRVGVNPTTGYAEVGPRTYSVPSNAKVTGGTGVPSVTVLPGGAGLRQSFPSGIEITAVKSPGTTGRSVFDSALRASIPALKSAATRCFTSLKCNFAIAAGSAGLEAMFDAVDWVMTDGALIKPVPGVPVSGGSTWSSNGVGRYISAEAACKALYPGVADGPKFTGLTWVHPGMAACETTFGQMATVVRSGTSCPSGSVYDSQTGACVGPASTAPASPSDIADLIDRTYAPQPSDWPFLSPEIDLSDPGVTVGIDSWTDPNVEILPSITTFPDGSTSETTTSFDFDWLGNPGKEPRLDITETTTTKTYSPTGAPTGTTTNVSTTTGSSAPKTEIDIPTDCEFMPTVCAFILWVKDPGPDDTDPFQELENLVQVYEDPGVSITIGPFNAACPAPRELGLSMFPGIAVSFQPFCDLATAVRFWLLSIAYFGAAYVTVRSI